MTVLVGELNVRDSQILELLRGGAPMQRVIDVGRHRRTWTPTHVATVVAFHFDPAANRLHLVPPPEPEKKPRKVAQCGTTSGYSRHLRLGEKPCLRCSDAKRAYSRGHRNADRPDVSDTGLTEWTPERFAGRPTIVVLTAAQAAVLEQLCNGLSNGRIGKALDITEDTVKSHMKELLLALGATDRLHAAVRVLSEQVRVQVRATKAKAS